MLELAHQELSSPAPGVASSSLAIRVTSRSCSRPKRQPSQVGFRGLIPRSGIGVLKPDAYLTATPNGLLSVVIAGSTDTAPVAGAIEYCETDADPKFATNIQLLS